ncbi:MULTISPECIES: hypothetical protein [Bradyrhizobium]|uniref:hypothetical protein n=1 Tax=Bradyrhizobium TaxID=374 RepID=UPI001EDA51AD|nr:hypothetical protein [Bradyrhizobium zhengyangense]MCG2639661.1 hypothetical protein [Bradyrhizobium zhengyangense]
MTETLVTTTTPVDPASAQARRDELVGNAEWRERYLNGGPAERTEMHSLNEVIAGQAQADQQMDRSLSIDFARDRGVSEETIKYHLIDRTPISAEEHAAALRWRQSHFADPKWRELYMTGDVTARREATLSSILISSPVKPAA